MKIAVCVKAVPDRAVKMDAETGTIERVAAKGIVNMYDYAAIETALQIREKLGGEVTVFTMGPPSAEIILREAVSFGVDHAVLITDLAFGGADVLATAFTLAKAIEQQQNFDLVVCGKQTTDGDTAQVGGALAALLGYTYFPWVTRIVDVTTKGITGVSDMGEECLTCKAYFPLLLSVAPGICTVRMPSLFQKIKSRKMEIITLGLRNFALPKHQFGAAASPTSVVKIHQKQIEPKALPVEWEAKQLLKMIQIEAEKVQGKRE